MLLRFFKKSLLVPFSLAFYLFAEAQIKLDIQWDHPVMVSRSVPTLQVVVNPPLRKGSLIHDPSFAALKSLGADYVRYVPWLPYPRLGVAELDPPNDQKTFWDFSLIDPMTIDFLEATKGHPVILNFSTIPQWMYATGKQVLYPKDPDEVSWNYSQGNTLTDSTCKQVTDYYSRLYSWYTEGGFTDELGKYHASGYHYDIPYWEILNEPDLEHQPTPEQYTREYDAIVSGIKKLSPKTKFVGMALAYETDPHWFAYFLNPAHHQKGIPLDMISYHFYATSTAGQTIDDMQFTYFERADGFLNSVRYIENLRKTLTPDTKTTIDEVGSILHNEEAPIPDLYWNLSGALYAYLYLQLTMLGIDIIGESQLVGYPGQFPSVSMIDWKNGNPNARFNVLKLLKDNFGPGDILVKTELDQDPSGAISAQGFLTSKEKKILLVNKRNKPYTIFLPDGFKAAKISMVDLYSSKEGSMIAPGTNMLELTPFEVAIISK
jgi:hypothetical protein